MVLFSNNYLYSDTYFGFPQKLLVGSQKIANISKISGSLLPWTSRGHFPSEPTRGALYVGALKTKTIYKNAKS